jgi:hypothetical protein
MLQKNRDIDEDVSHRIKVGWLKWRQVSDLLCDPRVPLKLKVKFYMTAIRLTMLYGVEYWPTKRRYVQQLSVAEMCMLWWICCHTRSDRVWNVNICERLGVSPVEENLVQHRLRWFGHIQRRPAEARSGVIRWTDNKKRDRWWLNLTWEESVKRDLKDWCITKVLALDRREWKLAIHVSEYWSSVSSFYCICQVFFPAFFHFFDLTFYWLFSFFYLVFYRLFFRTYFFFAHVVLSLAYLNLLENKRLSCCCCCNSWASICFMPYIL